MIGVGITTTDKRPHHRNRWKQVAEQFCNGMTVHFADNFDSVAKGKNDCLRALKDCEYVFLFDDDCFPYEQWWEQLFIDYSNKTQCQHFSYLHNYGIIRKIGGKDGVSIYNNSAGCMMFMTKEAIQKVGAYDERFGKYGFEHINYSERIRLAGLSPARNICPDAAVNFIYSMDLDSWMSFDFKHHSTLSTEEMETSVNEAGEHLNNEEEIYIEL